MRWGLAWIPEPDVKLIRVKHQFYPVLDNYLSTANKTLAFGLSVDFSEENELIEELGDSFWRFDGEEEPAEFSEFLEMELPGHTEELSGFALSENWPACLPSVELFLSEALRCRPAGSEVAASSLIPWVAFKDLVGRKH